MKRVIFFILGVYFIYYAYNILRDLFSQKGDTDSQGNKGTNIAFEELEHQPQKVDASFFAQDEKATDELEHFYKEVEEEEFDMDSLYQEEDLSEVQILTEEVEHEDHVKTEKEKKIDENEEVLNSISKKEKKKISLFSNLETIETKISNSFTEEKKRLIQELISNPDSIDITEELSLLPN